MASTIYGMTNNNMFTSPVSPFQMNPVSNLMYGSLASNVYSKTVAKNAQSTLSSYFTSLNNDLKNLKSASTAQTTGTTLASSLKKTVTSSDNTAISGTADLTASVKTYNVKVSQLAASQINKGTELKSANKPEFNQGLNTFTIKSNGKAKTVTFEVNKDDTNKSSLAKMASAINKAGAGVTASVVNDEKAGTSYLKLSSDKTGTDSAFTLADTNGNAVAASGAGKTQDKALNAEYTVNGRQYSSQSNNVTLDNDKVKLTLNKADDKSVKLTVGVDTKGLQSEIDKLNNKYNSYMNVLSAGDQSQSTNNSNIYGMYSGVVLDMLL